MKPMLKKLLHCQKQPVPVDVLTGYAYWAKSYPPQAHNPLMLLEEQAMLSLLPANLSGKSCLDLACGTGRYLLQLQARHAGRAVGVDYSAHMLDQSINNYQLTINNLQLALAPFFPLPFNSSAFDLIVCGLAVGHEKNLEATLSEAARVLRPGGELLYSDIHPTGTLAGWKRTFAGDNGVVFDLEHHLHRIDDHRQACRAAGLTIDAVLEPLFDGKIPAVLVIRAVKSN